MITWRGYAPPTEFPVRRCGTCVYVMENPVRAGLCERAVGRRWSACRYTLD